MTSIPEVQETILESLMVNEVQVQIVQHDTEEHSRTGARFAPVPAPVALEPVYDMQELTERGDAVAIATAILRHIAGRSSLFELSNAFARLREAHDVNEGPR